MAVGGENLVDTIDQFDQYLEKVQDATTRAQERINNLSKERDATRLMLDRTRLQAEMDKQELTDDFKAKEQSLKRDMDEMQLQLVAEKETVKDYQERVKRIEAERQALDDEFSKLKLQYERDSNNWNEKYRSEQEVHRLEIANARDEASRRQMEADRALQEAQRRLASVEEQLSAKIKEHEAAIRALKDNMK
jgi:chromosome segregation ATPase